MTWFHIQCIKVIGTCYIITGALQPSRHTLKHAGCTTN